ncbi:MAG: ParB/RepB/Spo0J family partition protein [Clostridia bacterium]|nr:ParB/RepB/Spo0J family partition protein [Clostridia bacterium]
MSWIPTKGAKPGSKDFRRISIRQIRKNPNQPRKRFDPQALQELAESIRRYGIITPLTVRETADGYELIAGERRLRAASIAGLNAVPCYVVKVTDRESALMALLENLQRKDLDCFEEAASLQRLCQEYHMTQQEAAERVGKTQSAVANKLRLLRLSARVTETVRLYSLSERHARALLRLEDEQRQLAAATQMGKKQLTVAQAEALVEKMLQEKPRGRRQGMIKDVRLLCNTVERAVRLLREGGVTAEYSRKQEGTALVLTVRVENAARRGEAAG